MSPIPQSKAPQHSNQLKSLQLRSSTFHYLLLCNYIKSPQGGKIKNRRKYLDKFHMYIVFGYCVTLEGHSYVLLLFDVATR